MPVTKPVTKNGGLSGALPLPTTAFEKDHPRVNACANAEYLVRTALKQAIKTYDLTETEECAILTKMQWEILAGCLVGERQMSCEVTTP